MKCEECHKIENKIEFMRGDRRRKKIYKQNVFISVLFSLFCIVNNSEKIKKTSIKTNRVFKYILSLGLIDLAPLNRLVIPLQNIHTYIKMIHDPLSNPSIKFFFWPGISVELAQLSNEKLTATTMPTAIV